MRLARYAGLLLTVACGAVWAQPVLSVTKTHSANFTQGQTGSWTITVTNMGTAATSGTVTVTDTLPAGYTLSPLLSVSNWSCTGTGTVTCTDSVDTPMPGSAFPPLSLFVNVPPNSPTSVQNSATASGGGAASSAMSNTDTVTVNQVAAAIVASPSSTPQSTFINTAFAPLVVTVTDAGGVGVPNATVTFTVVPNVNGAGGTFTGVNPATTGANGQASVPFTANGTAGSYSVTAASGTITGATFALTNTVPPVPVLSISKSHIGNFTQGQMGTWLINVRNGGTGSTSGTVTVTDTLPAGYTLAPGASVSNWTCSGAGTGSVICTDSVDVVAPGGSFPPLSLTVNVPVNSPTSVQNLATVSGGGAASSAMSTPDSVAVNQVAATITATSGTPQSAPTNAAFANPLVATVKDAGGVAMANATVTFTVIPNNNGASGTFVGGNTAMTAVNGQATSSAFKANGTAGTYSVMASSGAASGATFLLTNTTPATPTLSIIKSHGGSFTQGQTGTWTINVSNQGTGSTSGTVTVTDTLPAGYTLVPVASVSNWSCTGAGTGSVSCTDSIDAVAAGGSFPPLNLTVNVPANSPPSVQNSATVSGGGAASAVTSAPDTVTVSQVASTIVATSGGGQSAPINTAFASPLVATVKDAGGNPVPNVTVTFTVVPNNGASGTFAGGVNTSTTGSNGQATSQVFTANGTLGTYSVTAASGAATGAVFPLTNAAGTASKLTFTTPPPANGAAGTPFSAIVQVQDAGGNLVPSSNAAVTISSIPAGMTSATVNAVNGVATFNNLVITAANSYTLTATATGLASATSTSITIGAGTASQVVLTTPPGNGTAGQALAPAVVAKIEDAFNNVVTTSTSPVTVSSTPSGVTGTLTVNAISGVATFNNLVFNATTSYTLTLGSPGLASANSGSFTISAGSGSKLVFTTQPPSSGPAGQPFSAVVTVEDNIGNTVTGSPATVTITSSPAGITGTTTVTAVNGVATFSNLMLDTTGGYTLTAAATGLTNATSTTITIAAGPASQVVFTTPPGSGTAGQALTPGVVVKIEDAFNNVVANSSAQVTASSTPAGVGGTLQVNAVNGVATFSNLVFNAATNYTLTVASPGLAGATSPSFTITSGGGSKLVFTTQPPSSGTAGTPFGAVVQVQDSNGNVVSGSNAQVTIGSSPTGLGGTTTATAVNGVATFNNLTLDTAGSYTLSATSTGLTNATSTSITIGPAAASQVVFTTAPNSGTAGQALTPAVVAKIEDQFNNVVNSSVQVTVASTPSGVSGTLQVSAVSGVATFNNLVFNGATNYTLTASSPGLTSATSASFTISAGSGNKLVFTVQPPANGMAGEPLSPSVAVQVQDNNGNLVAGSTASISISSTPAGIGGTLTSTAAGGIAVFNNLQFKTTGSYTLTATSTGLSNATSTAILIGAGAPSKLALTVQPTSGTAGQSLSPAVVVQVQDANGNLVTTSSVPVTISSTPTGVGGTLTVNASGGIATFSSLSFTAANNYTLTAASPGLASANSTSFTISAGSGNKLAISVQPPATGTAGQPLSPAIVVQIQDSNGNAVTGSTAAVSIGSTPAGVGGTLTVNASNGVATFSNLTFTATGSFTLTATSTGLANATSTTVTVAPGPAAKLAFTVQPSSGTAGQPLTPAVVVEVQDTNGNLVPTSTASVSLTSAPAGVGGTLTQAAVAGIATFSNLAFTTAGNYTLTAAATGLGNVSSNSLTISPGSGNKLVFTTQPAASGTAGQTLSPVVVQIQDSNGNVVTGSTAAVSISPQAGIGGTLTVNAVAGIATFSNLVFTSTGSFTLTVTSTGLANASSTPVAIAPGPATKMAFAVQPSSATAGQVLNPPIVVQIEDANGNVVTSSNATVLITSTPSGVGGTASVTALGGVATFSNLSFATAGNYTLTASASGASLIVNSPPFTIAAGAPGGISVVSGGGQTAQVTKNFANPLVAVIRDSASNPVPNVTVTFTAPSSGPSGTFGGSAIATAVTGTNGQAVSPTFTANSISGTYNVVASAAGVTTTAAFAMTNTASLAIMTSALTGATQAAQYNQQLVATGGTPPYTWAIAAGTLPTGLTLLNSGVITGTPTVSGSFSFTALVRDNAGATASQPLALAVASTLAISSCPASTGIVGQAYSSTATATGGQTPYTWNFNAGAFPPGLVLNPLTGALTGTPTSAGTFTVSLVVTDKSQANAQLGCGFTIAPVLTITTATVSDASQSAPYSQSFNAIGGKGPYTWAVAGGTVPPGLSLLPNGTLSGMATTTGLYGFTVAVTDSTKVTVTAQYTMNVFAGLVVGSCPLNTAEVNFPYNSTLVGEGGAVPYAWSVTTGSLPAGLQLNTAAGTISGTPQQVGTATLVFTLTDKSARTVTKQCSLNVLQAVAISTASLSGGSTGNAYSAGVTVSGGVSPYVYSTTGGSLPPGLAIDAASGKITGSPISAGSFAFTVQVTDNLGAQATKNLSITVAQGLTIPNCPAPVGSVGQSYNATLVAQGGTTPYAWTVSSGNLPAGLMLQTGNSVTMIAGSPTQPGTSAFVLQAADAAGGSVTRACSIQISAASLTFTAPSLPNGTLGVAYSQTLTASGGVAPYVWSIVGTGAPQGFSIDPAKGVLSGTPTTVGAYTFTIQVTDQNNAVAQQTVTITVQAGTPPTITITGLTDSQTVAPDAQPTFNIQLSGSYPADIDGTVTLTVTPDPTVGVDDPTIQFASGGRTLTFTVPANTTTPVFTAPVVALQTGTVVASIQLSVKLSSGGVDITPPGSSLSVRVFPQAPVIVSMTATQSASGVQVQIVGYSTTRVVTQGTFQFTTASGTSPSPVTVQLSDAATSWFQSSQSMTQYGGQFMLTQPFTFQGTVGTLSSVTVTLSNAQGASAPFTAHF